MKRWLMLLMIALLCANVGALSESVCALDSYLATLDAEALEEQADGALMVGELAEGVELSLCVREDALLSVSVIAGQGAEDLPSCARMAFEACGLASGEELAAALDAIPIGEQVDLGTLRLVHLGGEQREGYYLCAVEDYDGLCWQPVYGGQRRHANPECSGMDVPRLVSPEAAEAMGFEPCGRCY